MFFIFIKQIKIKDFLTVYFGYIGLEILFIKN